MIKLQGDYVAISVSKAETETPGGVLLPENVQTNSQVGKVVGVGPGRILDDGKRSPIFAKVGDTVLYEKFSGTIVEYDGKSYLLVHDKDILAILED